MMGTGSRFQAIAHARCGIGTGATGLEPATSGVTVLSGVDQVGSAQVGT